MKRKHVTLDEIFRKKVTLLSTVTAESVARCENSIVVAENTIGLSGTVEGMLTLIERQCSLVTEIDYLCVVIFSFFYCTV